MIGRTTTVLHRRYRLLLEFNIIVASPLDMECWPSRLLIPVLWCFWFQIFWRHSTLKSLPFQSFWSYGHGALQVSVLYFTNASLLYLNTISAPTGQWPRYLPLESPLILAIIIIQPLGYTNPVESQDHHTTALFDMRHLDNGTIFLHRDICVFIVPLLGHMRLRHHLAMILNPLLLLCRGVFHSRLNTHLFSKRFPLQPSLIHGLLSRILTCRCMEVSDVAGVGECGRLSQHGWI